MLMLILRLLEICRMMIRMTGSSRFGATSTSLLLLDTLGDVCM